MEILSPVDGDATAFDATGYAVIDTGSDEVSTYGLDMGVRILGVS